MIVERACEQWKPEFYWEGAKQITLPSRTRGTGELLKVYPSGFVWWSQQVTIELNCPFAQGSNLDFLPFDTQTCTFTMGYASGPQTTGPPHGLVTSSHLRLALSLLTTSKL